MPGSWPESICYTSVICRVHSVPFLLSLLTPFLVSLCNERWTPTWVCCWIGSTVSYAQGVCSKFPGFSTQGGVYPSRILTELNDLIHKWRVTAMPLKISKKGIILCLSLSALFYQQIVLGRVLLLHDGMWLILRLFKAFCFHEPCLRY